MLYGLEILPLNKIPIATLEKFHINSLRMIQSLPERTATATVYLLLGALPVEVHKKQLSLLHSILDSDNNRIKQVLNRQISVNFDQYLTVRWHDFRILTYLIRALWVRATYMFTDSVIRSCDSPDWSIQTCQIYPSELQLNKANSSDTEAPFLDLNLSITNGIVSFKNYDKRDDFNFEIVNFPFLDGDVPLSFLWCIYFSAYPFC